MSGSADGPRVRARDPQGIAAGAVFVILGLAGLWFGRNLSVGTAEFMEVGYVPRLLCFILIGLGAIIAFQSLRRAGFALTAWAWRPLLVLSAGVLAFGLLIDRGGMVAASVAVTVLSTLAAQRLPWRQTVALTAVLTLLMVVLFHWALALPIPVWPR